MAQQKPNNTKQKPVFLVKPASRLGGLDYLHVALVALVVVLIGLSFSLAYFKPATVVSRCAYGTVNGTCYSPKYNSTQAIAAAENMLANYQYINSSLSLLPYYSEPNRSVATYAPDSNTWLVTVPYLDPLDHNATFYVSFSFYGDNLTLQRPYIQTVTPTVSGNNSVVSFGTVQIGGRVMCNTTTPFPVYLMTDPYAPGAFASIARAVNLSHTYSKQIDMSYQFIFTNYSSRFYQGYGTYQTQTLGKYLYCSSEQGMIGGYAANLSKIFTGRPLGNETLYQTAVGSGLNPDALNGCLANSTTALIYQAQLAKLYDVVSTPQFIVDCRYTSLPETATYAINYTLKQING